MLLRSLTHNMVIFVRFPVTEGKSGCIILQLQLGVKTQVKYITMLSYFAMPMTLTVCLFTTYCKTDTKNT